MWRPRYRPHCQAIFQRRAVPDMPRMSPHWMAQSLPITVGTCRGTSGCGDDAKTPVGKPVRADQDLDGGRAKRVIVPLRGTDWGGGVVSPGFVPLRGTHLGFDSLAALEPLAPSVLTMRVISKPRRGDGV